MKNLLSENMLRFGTKNLSEAAQRELVVKSIMETINAHGLHGAVRQRLMEQAKQDPAWLTTAKDTLANQNLQNGKYMLSVGIIKAGSSYTNPENIVATDSRNGFSVAAKGSVWYPSPSLTVAYCACMYFDDNSMLDSLRVNPQGTTAADVAYDQTKLQQLLAGTYKYNGKVVTGQKSNLVWYPSINSKVATQGGKYFGFTGDGDAMRTAMLADYATSPGKTGDVPAEYIPGGK